MKINIQGYWIEMNHISYISPLEFIPPTESDRGMSFSILLHCGKEIVFPHLFPLGCNMNDEIKEAKRIYKWVLNMYIYKGL